MTEPTIAAAGSATHTDAPLAVAPIADTAAGRVRGF